MISRQNHPGFRVSPTSNDQCLYNKRRKYRDMGLEEGHRNMEVEPRVTLSKPGDPGGHQKLKASRKRSPLETSKEEHSVLKPLSTLFGSPRRLILVPN